MNGDEGFWTALDRLVTGAKLVIDRPRGSPHPRYPGDVYPLDYGYLEGTTAGDGAGIDAWRGSSAEPRVVGAIVTVDGAKRDSEIKLLLGCTRAEAEAILTWHNTGLQAGLLLWRGSE